MTSKKTFNRGIQLWLERSTAALFLTGQVVVHLLKAKINRRNTWEQMAVVGPDSISFAAEIGTMRVTEQIDALYVLKTDPIDYLVLPRVIACSLMLPILTIISLITGMLGGLFIATTLYGISQITFIDSIRNFLELWDLFSAMTKSFIFGALVAVIGCNWGLTTTGGAKGVGESTTTAVVTALIAIFISNFFLSWLMFQGPGRDLMN